MPDDRGLSTLIGSCGGATLFRPINPLAGRAPSENYDAAACEHGHSQQRRIQESYEACAS